jgi:hypothetical protein
VRVLSREFSTIRIYKEDQEALTQALLKLEAKLGRRIYMAEFFHMITQRLNRLLVEEGLEGLEDVQGLRKGGDSR